MIGVEALVRMRRQQTPFNQQAGSVVSAMFSMAEELGLLVIVARVETEGRATFMETDTGISVDTPQLQGTRTFAFLSDFIASS